MTDQNYLLSVRNLHTYFHVRGKVAKAVDGVSLTIKAGETLGLVGESGCGKSVTAHSIIQLIPDPPGCIESGEIWFKDINLLSLSGRQMGHIRGRHISMIFQEPMTSLNPVFTVGDQVGETIQTHQKLSRKETWHRVVDIFRLVGIPSAEKRISDYPHQMSGGMRQRVMIAIALACRPELMIADEPTTALDVTIQAQILDLMNKLKSDISTAILYISHDMGVIAEMAQNVAVMYAGKIMEYTDVGTLFSNPKHPYTIGLLESIPVVGQSREHRHLNTISGVVPSLYNLPSGCLFSDRCKDVFDVCYYTSPEMIHLREDHRVRCLKYA